MTTKIIKPGDFIMSDQDVANAQLVDAGELLRCPLCGDAALSCAVRNEQTRNVVYRVFCNGGDCGVSLSVCLGGEQTVAAARMEAVERWNKRRPRRLTPELLYVLEESAAVFNAAGVSSCAFCGETPLQHSTTDESCPAVTAKRILTAWKEGNA